MNSSRDLLKIGKNRAVYYQIERIIDGKIEKFNFSEKSYKYIKQIENLIQDRKGEKNRCC